MSRGQGRRSSASPRSASSSATARWPARTPRCCTSPPGPSPRRSSKAGVAVDDVDLFEINEAFAAVGLASADELGIDEKKLNVNGGAIALGHPVGMSGTRVALTALLELRRRGGGLAAVALCGGGGQGDAAVLASLA